MLDFWRVALAELEDGRRVYLSLVAANRKGSPGTPAARMLVFENGTQLGTIGGGIMEQRLLQEAHARLTVDEALQPSVQVLQHRSSDPQLASGLICGGQQTLIHAVLEGGATAALLREIVAAIAEEQPASLQLTPQGLSLHALPCLPETQQQFVVSSTEIGATRRWCPCAGLRFLVATVVRRWPA